MERIANHACSGKQNSASSRRRKPNNYGGLVGRERRLYDIWHMMHRRCKDKLRIDYRYYGGRGISVSDEWNSFPAFVSWAKGAGYNDSLTLDRIDVNGDYEPSNCRWISMKDQAKNRKSCVYLNCAGEILTVTEWADRISVPRFTVYSWVKRRGKDYAQDRVEKCLKQLSGEVT